MRASIIHCHIESDLPLVAITSHIICYIDEAEQGCRRSDSDCARKGKRSQARTYISKYEQTFEEWYFMLLDDKRNINTIYITI